MQKMDLVLTAAARYIRQIPAAELDKPFRNRNRPIRVLAHHVFRIVEGFLESMDDGALLTYERIMESAPPALSTADDIARYGEGVLARAQRWWADYAGPLLRAPDADLLRHAPAARGARAHGLAPGAARAPADADPGESRHPARPAAERRRPRRAAAAREGLG